MRPPLHQPRLSRCATMVYSTGGGYAGGHWGGVSGVPGLGVSIPAQHARPGSSSAGDVHGGDDGAWDNAGKSRLQVPFPDEQIMPLRGPCRMNLMIR